MKRLLLLLLLPLVHATVMNSADFIAALQNSTLHANESIYIEDWNGTLEIINNTLVVVPEFNHTDVNVTYGQSLELYGDYTVTGPAACTDMTGQFQNLSGGESRTFIGNWTVGCAAQNATVREHVNLLSRETRNLTGNYSVTCLAADITPINFSETRTLGFNQSVSKAFTNDFCSIFYNYTAPPQETQVQAVQAPLAIDEDIVSGACYKKDEGNISIEVCAEACEPEIQTEYQTLFDLGESDVSDCENPVEVRGQPLCYDSVSGYCPADVLLSEGREGCTRYAVETALTIQDTNISDLNGELLDMTSQRDQLQRDLDSNKSALGVLEGQKSGCESVMNDYLQGAIVIVILLGGILVYLTYFHKDKSLPNVTHFKHDEKRPYRPKVEVEE